MGVRQGSTKLECNKATYETIVVERAQKGIVYFKGISLILLNIYSSIKKKKKLFLQVKMENIGELMVKLLALMETVQLMDSIWN